jgi:hypothetical protein
MRQQAWNVYLFGKWIETVYYQPNVDREEVLQGLVDHDGFDARISVRRG